MIEATDGTPSPCVRSAEVAQEPCPASSCYRAAWNGLSGSCSLLATSKCAAATSKCAVATTKYAVATTKYAAATTKCAVAPNDDDDGQPEFAQLQDLHWIGLAQTNSIVSWLVPKGAFQR